MLTNLTRLSAVLLLMMFLSACAAQIAQDRFDREYRCHNSRAVDLGGGAVRIDGCGHRVTYVCITGNRPVPTCVKEQEERSTDERPYAAPRIRPAPTRPSAPPDWSQTGVSRTKHPDGFALITFTANLLEPQTSLSVTGGPVRDTEHVLIVFSKSQSKGALKSCELRVVVDGQPVVLPEVHYRAEGSTEQLRMKLPVSQLAQWAQAQRVIAQACDVRFELDQEAMKLTREFLMRFQEELALNGKITPANAGPAPSDSL